MAISTRQIRILNLYQTNKHKIDATEKSVEMLIIQYHFDSTKYFLINYSYMWCVILIPARFYMFKANNKEGLKSAQI